MTGPGSALETRAEGSPASVAAAADWLRGGLAGALEAAADDLLGARALALDAFRGRAGTAYVALDERLVRLLDEHADRVTRAARLVDALADRLRAHHERMASVRQRAAEGGLTVTGTVVTVPAPTLSHGLDGSDPLGLFMTLRREVLAERAALAAWVADHLADAADELETTALERWAGHLRRHLDGLGRELGLAYAEHTLEEAARVLRERAEDLEAAQRSPGAGRAPGPDLPPAGRADDLRDLSRLAGVGGRLIGPVSTAADGYAALESDEPSRGLAGMGAGAIAGGLGLGLATATGAPLIGAVGLGAAATYAGSQVGQHVWGAIPDKHTDRVDDWVSDRWDDTKDGAKDAARGTWKEVRGWLG